MPSHPTYPRNIIAEALCEVRFTHNPDSLLSVKGIASLFKEILDDYPKMNTQNEMGVEFAIDPISGHAVQRIVQGKGKTQFRSEDEKRLIQVGEGLFTCNAIQSYPGWDAIENTVIDTWEKVIPKADPAYIERVGLRYINRVPKADDTTSIGKWIKASPYIPERLTSSQGNSFYRMEVHLTSERKVVIQVGDAHIPNVGNHIVLDIDCIQAVFKKLEKEEFKQIINDLHNEIWDVFSSSKSDALEAYMQGKNV